VHALQDDCYVWSVLLPLLFSELQSPLLPTLLIPDDVYGSELLSMVSNAVVPTLNVRILVDSPALGLPPWDREPNLSSS
jgi:hypothetical protein